MKVLVLSDSHSARSFMRLAIRAVAPDAVVHLGDHYEDGLTMKEENENIPFHLVPGNCDWGRMCSQEPEMLCYSVCGARLFMTHGHRQYVKQGLSRLLVEARKLDAHAVLYGHTHVPDCHCENDGLWVMNPGTCGSFGGSVGLMEIQNGHIQSCRILRQQELEELL